MMTNIRSPPGINIHKGRLRSLKPFRRAGFFPRPAGWLVPVPASGEVPPSDAWAIVPDRASCLSAAGPVMAFISLKESVDMGDPA
jgi:hypothetical protein